MLYAKNSVMNILRVVCRELKEKFLKKKLNEFFFMIWGELNNLQGTFINKLNEITVSVKAVFWGILMTVLE